VARLGKAGQGRAWANRNRKDDVKEEGENFYSTTEPIKRVFQKLRQHFGNELRTLTSAQYDYHRESDMPPAQALMKRARKSWAEILNLLDLAPALNRLILSRLSNSLHLLEKMVVEKLGVWWAEKNLPILYPTQDNHPRYKTMRPDSLYLERIYVKNNRLLVLDVKLSLQSAGITIYKYLPIFVNGLARIPQFSQLTFFPQWLSENAIEPGYRPDGQMALFYENNILYICYLIGKPVGVLLPGTEISAIKREFRGRTVHKKGKKRLPLDMEVRFIEFDRLPGLYSRLAGMPYNDSLR
jgi:hypothetical protein